MINLQFQTFCFLAFAAFLIINFANWIHFCYKYRKHTNKLGDHIHQEQEKETEIGIDDENGIELKKETCMIDGVWGN